MNRDRTPTFAFEAYSDILRPKWAQLHRKEIHFYPSVSVRHTSLSFLSFLLFRPISKVFEKFPAEWQSSGRKIHHNLTNTYLTRWTAQAFLATRPPFSASARLKENLKHPCIPKLLWALPTLPNRTSTFTCKKRIVIVIDLYEEKTCYAASLFKIVMRSRQDICFHTILAFLDLDRLAHVSSTFVFSLKKATTIVKNDMRLIWCYSNHEKLVFWGQEKGSGPWVSPTCYNNKVY